MNQKEPIKVTERNFGINKRIPPINLNLSKLSNSKSTQDNKQYSHSHAPIRNSLPCSSSPHLKEKSAVTERQNSLTPILNPKEISSRLLTTRVSLNPKSKSAFRLLPLRVKLPTDYFIALTSPENVTQENSKNKLKALDSLCDTERKFLKKAKNECRAEKKNCLKQYRNCARLAKLAYESRLKEAIPPEFWEFRKKMAEMRRKNKENKHKKIYDLFGNRDLVSVYRNEQLFKKKSVNTAEKPTNFAAGES
ncbi:unnamed protein product [Blepharisma stoltei]|uniref:Uncharacterized protein n=1 Tax=Blepharisma stoltei TaxID=1481888 RepID=A0AAU9ILQ3_9CILI|nr:unnamed protein product [Blepharisma stoltei]